MEARQIRHRTAVEKWKRANYAYYLAQKRALASRPEYLARRREIYRKKRSLTRRENLSTEKQYEFEKIHTRSDHCLDRCPDCATSPEERGGSRVA
jgi:hypothetical protein